MQLKIVDTLKIVGYERMLMELQDIIWITY